MGSVKDLLVRQKPTAAGMGRGVFRFTDGYSVFDYGKMPDELCGKGAALCRMACWNFRELEKQGIKTHFRGMPSENEMEIDLVRVLYPQKGEIGEGETNYLIPLEIIFRNSLPAGSSVFRRLENGEVTLGELGLQKKPKPNERLPSPIVDLSTKLEPSDRYLSWAEAKEMAKLTDAEVEKIKKTTLLINGFITKRAEEIGLEHADGKVEFALGPKRELILVDVCGTPDENRFLCGGVNLSKQVVRDYYKENCRAWVKNLEKAKREKKPKGEYPVPPNLPEDFLGIVGDIYNSVSDAWTGETLPGAPAIEEVVEEYRMFLRKCGAKG